MTRRRLLVLAVAEAVHFTICLYAIATNKTDTWWVWAIVASAAVAIGLLAWASDFRVRA